MIIKFNINIFYLSHVLFCSAFSHSTLGSHGDGHTDTDKTLGAVMGIIDYH